MRAIPNGEKEEGKSLRALVDFTYVQAGPFPVFRRAMELARQLLPAVAPFDSAKKKKKASLKRSVILLPGENMTCFPETDKE